MSGLTDEIIEELAEHWTEECIMTGDVGEPPDPFEQNNLAAILALKAARRRIAELERNAIPYQERVAEWMRACFDAATIADRHERAHRFLEEALELAQAIGCNELAVRQLVAYVYGRPVGDVAQEVGGVAVTLAALCGALRLTQSICEEAELSRCWANIERIRAKHAAKPKFGPLPGPTTEGVT